MEVAYLAVAVVVEVGEELIEAGELGVSASSRDLLVSILLDGEVRNGL